MKPKSHALCIKFVRAVATSVLWGLAGVAAHAQPAPAESRGKLLYETHCISCHSTQMHWRDASVATSWDALKQQVRKWQANVGLQWSEADIVDVSRHLNDTIYRHPQTSDRVGLLAPR